MELDEDAAHLLPPNVLEDQQAHHHSAGHNHALLVGFVSTLCFTLQYAPQIILNWRRKSVKGFSSGSIVIKMIGAAFLWVNSSLSGEALPVTMYGFMNVMQHAIFFMQFAVYGEDSTQLLWILIPFFPCFLGTAAPWTIPWTQHIKPMCQVLSHLPQLYVCYRMKSTAGVSMHTMHLSLLGGLTGLYMCWVIPPSTRATYSVYSSSLFQAATLYALAFRFEGLRALRIPGFSGKATSKSVKSSQKV